jgi:hypothetical protein
MLFVGGPVSTLVAGWGAGLVTGAHIRQGRRTGRTGLCP